MNLSQEVYHTLLRHHLLPENRLLVVAVSGGADSLALLHILHTLAPQLNLKLHVATLNHGLRGKVGAADAAFVQQIAHNWHIPCTVGQVDVPHLMQEQRLGLETAARQARYAFLVDVATQQKATYIATAHQADDQAETVLMHVLRGAGVNGLTGMPWRSPVPGYPDLTLIRPLRDITRAEIESYCATNDLEPRVDASNADMDLLRNAIRLNILPQLRRINPQVQRALNQLADIVAIEQDFIEQQYASTVEPHIFQSEGRWILPCELFRQLHTALQRRFIYHAAQTLSQQNDRYSGYRHINAAVATALAGQVGAVAQLRGGLRMRVDYDDIVVESVDAPRFTDNLPLILPDNAISIPLDGITPIPGTDWSLVLSKAPFEGYGARITLPVDSRLLMRNRQTGDRFAPLGMDGKHQTIKKWMINRKIPRHLRDQIPLLVVNNEVAVVMTGDTWAVSESFAVRPDSERITYLGIVEPSL